MHSQEAIQALIEARLASLREASEKRDVDALMSWHAKDAVFTDPGTEAEPSTQQRDPANMISQSEWCFSRGFRCDTRVLHPSVLRHAHFPHHRTEDNGVHAGVCGCRDAVRGRNCNRPSPRRPQSGGDTALSWRLTVLVEMGGRMCTMGWELIR